MERQLDIRGVYRTMNFIDGMVALVYIYIKFATNNQQPSAIFSSKVRFGPFLQINKTLLPLSATNYRLDMYIPSLKQILKAPGSEKTEG